MDFFEHQDAARKRTGLLVVLMVVAVCCIIALVYGVVLVVVANGMSQADQSQINFGGNPLTPGTMPYLEMLALTSIGVLLVVLGGSFYKTRQLASGGGAVARSLGGRLVDPDTAELDERKLLNVVEEMAIASGMAVPDVYVMDDEDGINAFAAGWTPDNAVVGVTRGSIRQLSRDELQGVIAHEFSHILNGDMRLNIRLIGIIFGILALSVIGATLMRMLLHSGGSRRSRNRRDGDAKAALFIFAIGLSLYIIGWAGVFFGRLIQAAVSRQREFLADAASVQFTRNPDGIAGALRRIGGVSRGSRLSSSHAAEHSHMFFGSGVSALLSFGLATHPPLEDRIKRVMPSWDGSMLPPRDVHDEPADTGGTSASASDWRKHIPDAIPGLPGVPGASGAAGVSGLAGAAVAASAVEQIGQPSTQHLDMARALVGSIPATLRTAAHTTAGSQAVIYALLLDRRDPAVRANQIALLDRSAPGGVVKLAQRLADDAVSLEAGARLPLLDMATPSLGRLSPQERERLLDNVEAMVRADRKLDLFEWALQKVLERGLTRHGGGRVPVRYQKVSQVRDQAEALLSMLAHVGERDQERAAAAMGAGERRLGERVQLQPRDAVNLKTLSAALDDLAALAPLAKKKLIEACAACIAADGEVKTREAELMRVVAESLGVPMPPMLPGQALV